jgi:CheY-like chemotaxis protein
MTARILIIEDNLTNLELMRYLLEAFGHSVVSASDGRMGLAVVRSTALDLVVCDIHLPELDGYGVMQAIKQDARTRHLPVLAVTAQAMVGDRDKLLHAGFDGYIGKPIDPENFVNAIDEFLPLALRSSRIDLMHPVPQ